MSSAPPARPLTGSTFWLTFTAVVVCNFLSALDVTAVSTALPTITNELNGGDKFVWVGAAYGLAAAAILPFTGRLADTFGRRPTMLTCVALFFLGSALSGSAKNMNWLIGARSVYFALFALGHSLTILQLYREWAEAVSSTSHRSSSPTLSPSLSAARTRASSSLHGALRLRLVRSLEARLPRRRHGAGCSVRFLRKLESELLWFTYFACLRLELAVGGNCVLPCGLLPSGADASRKPPRKARSHRLGVSVACTGFDLY